MKSFLCIVVVIFGSILIQNANGVWNKCMEYQEISSNGNAVWYKLVGSNVVPKQGRCTQNEALLNDGTVVAPDSNIAKKVPSVPGLIVYRKDNKKLYVRSDKMWKVIALEKEVLQEAYRMVTPKLNELEKKLADQSQQMSKLDTKFTQLEKQIKDINQILQIGANDDELPSSVTLKREQNYLSNLKAFLPSKSSWSLCWRASQHGWASSTFHSKCDNKGPTVMIVRVTSSTRDYVFGGYTDVSWGGSSGYKTSKNSFIFSLKNHHIPPFKAPVYRNSDFAIYSSDSFGPHFGGGNDLHISSNANSNSNSHNNLGGTYQPPSGYAYNQRNTQELLAGSRYFTPSEIEVFYLR